MPNDVVLEEGVTEAPEYDLDSLNNVVDEIEKMYVQTTTDQLVEYLKKGREIANALRSDSYYSKAGRELALVQTNLDYAYLWATGRAKSNLYGDVVRQRIANAILWTGEAIRVFSEPMLD